MSTRRWEGLRDGIDDYMLLRRLRDISRTFPANAPQRKELEKMLDQATSDVLGDVTIHYPFCRVPPGSFRKADEWRRRIAEQIIYNGHTFSVDKDGEPVGQLSSFGSDRDPERLHELREVVLAAAWNTTWELLEPRQNEIQAIARILVEKKTVHGRLIHETLEAMAG